MVHRPYTSMVSRATSSSVLVTLVGLCLSPTPSDTIGSVPLSHSEWLLKVFTDSYTGELESSRVVVQGETREWFQWCLVAQEEHVRGGVI